MWVYICFSPTQEHLGPALALHAQQRCDRQSSFEGALQHQAAEGFLGAHGAVQNGDVPTYIKLLYTDIFIYGYYRYKHIVHIVHIYI